MTAPNEQRLPFRNRLLLALPTSDLGQFGSALEPVTLTRGQVLEGPGTPIDYVYFPETGIASVIAVSGDLEVEVGPIGMEGMSGLAIVSQAESGAVKTMVQIEGTAHRVPIQVLSDLIDASPTARRLFLRYTQAFALQTAHTVLAASVGLVEQRLARWLLMLHDRIDGDEIKLTHDFMAFMLAVRRPGVTVALHMLEGKALIRSYRGRVIIRDREGLRELCGKMYGVPEAEYRRLIGQPLDGSTS